MEERMKAQVEVHVIINVELPDDSDIEGIADDLVNACIPALRHSLTLDHEPNVSIYPHTAFLINVETGEQ
jgi:hypothetical protein